MDGESNPCACNTQGAQESTAPPCQSTTDERLQRLRRQCSLAVTSISRILTHHEHECTTPPSVHTPHYRLYGPSTDRSLVTPSIGGPFTLHEHVSEVMPRDGAPHVRLHDACSSLDTVGAPPTRRPDQQWWSRRVNRVPMMTTPGNRAVQHSLH